MILSTLVFLFLLAMYVVVFFVAPAILLFAIIYRVKRMKNKKFKGGAVLDPKKIMMLSSLTSVIALVSSVLNYYLISGIGDCVDNCEDYNSTVSYFIVTIGATLIYYIVIRSLINTAPPKAK